MNIRYIISLSALTMLTGASCWGAAEENEELFQLSDSQEGEEPRSEERSERLSRWLNSTVADVDENLIRAIGKNDIKGITRALQSGANVNGSEAQIMQPIELAIARNNKEAINQLIAFGLDINATLKNGDTPLMYTVLNGNAPITKFLLNNGAWANKQNENGETALIIAAQYGRQGNSWNAVNTVYELLRGGADKNLLNNADQTALDLARDPNITKIIKEWAPVGG